MKTPKIKPENNETPKKRKENQSKRKLHLKREYILDLDTN